MKTIALAALIALTALASPASAVDEDKELFGEVHVTFKNTEYAKLTVNKIQWDSYEFERSGRFLLIKDLPLANAPFEIEITPVVDTRAPESFKVEEKDFKKKRKGRMYILVAKRTLKFKVQKQETPPPEPPPEEPAPKPPETPDDDEL